MRYSAKTNFGFFFFSFLIPDDQTLRGMKVLCYLFSAQHAFCTILNLYTECTCRDDCISYSCSAIIDLFMCNYHVNSLKQHKDSCMLSLPFLIFLSRVEQLLICKHIIVTFSFSAIIQKLKAH